MSDDRNAILANATAIEQLKEALAVALALITAAEVRELRLVIALRYYADQITDARELDRVLSELGTELAK